MSRAQRAACGLVLALVAGLAAGCSAGGPARIRTPAGDSVASVAALASRAASAALDTALREARLDPVPPRTAKSGSRTGPMVIALTFDLCATPGDPEILDARVIDVLRAKEATATFYMGGLWAQGHPAEAAALGAVPYFEIANHSMTHPHMRTLPDEAIRAEVMDAQVAIRATTGRIPLTLRYPFDEYDDRTAAVVGSCGLVGVAEDVRTGDPDPNISGKRIADYVVQTAKPGSIVLMHANGNGVHTAEALPALIDGLRARGFEFVTVTEVLGIAPVGVSLRP